MRFSSRPYPGQNPRPTPLVELDEATNSIFCTIPWGQRSTAQKTIDRMKEFLAFANQDAEATSPLPRLTCLSTNANNLRTAAILANELIYREDNQDEYTSGVELFAASIVKNEFSWMQVGGPQIFLARGARPAMPLGSRIDLAFDLMPAEATADKNNSFLPALPIDVIGVDPDINMVINSFCLRPQDKIMILNHSHTPESIYHWRLDQMSLDDMAKDLALQAPSTAFWIGLIEVDPT